MPTYEYACQSCGTHVEVFQRFSEASLTECGVCGGPLRKVFHPAGILFKGAGFYVNDSRSGAAKSAGDSKSATGDGTSADPKPAAAASDSKPASGSDTKPSAATAAGESAKERSA